VFGIGGTELLIVAVFAFIIFGPDKIPEIARTVSKAVNQFKRTQADMERLVKAEMMGLDPDQASLFPTGDQAATQDSNVEKSPSKPSKASSLYGIVDEEEEDEE
jgi:TatA/E family protein of Tat protein translocase